MKNIKLYLVISFFILILSSCTKLQNLDEQVYGRLSIVNSNVPGSGGAASLEAAYSKLNDIITQVNYYAMQEHTTDELLGPTRGTDWDDFGTWRKLHLHTWDGAHDQIENTWNTLNSGLYTAGVVFETSTGQTKLEAQFLRAYFAFMVMDLYGQLPYRSIADLPQQLPKVYTRSQAYDFIETDLLACAPELPEWTKDLRFKANKQAAYFLLAKLTLNKAVYKQDPASPAGPYTHNAADMTKVVEYLRNILRTSNLTMANNYWINFSWNNYDSVAENIFGRSCNSDYVDNLQLGSQTNVQWLSAMGSHYNDWYGGWNGFTTTMDFYNSFTDGDVRKGARLSNFNTTGFTAGFRIGQQVKPDENGNLVNVLDRSGAPLIFTPNVSLYYSTEALGIRTNKYPMLASQRQAWNEKHDYIFFRYSDALLMLAEAIVRGGSAYQGAPLPLEAVNMIRRRSNAADLTTVDLPTILAERGRELYLEGWRRNDRIRFEVFNDPVNERELKSDGTRCVFPIPNIALASNPNLTQNAGY